MYRVAVPELIAKKVSANLGQKRRLRTEGGLGSDACNEYVFRTAILLTALTVGKQIGSRVSEPLSFTV